MKAQIGSWSDTGRRKLSNRLWRGHNTGLIKLWRCFVISNEVNNRDQDPLRETVVNVLMAEYTNIHTRVFREMDIYESTTVKIFMLMGVLFYFGIINFTHLEKKIIDSCVTFIVNLIFIGLIPFITIASVAVTAAHTVKIMIMGDYLKLIENKVNKVLASEAEIFEFPKKHVLGWEYWRVEYGNANKSNIWSEITLSGFLIIAFNIAMLLSLYIRLQYLEIHHAGENLGWWLLSVILFLFLIAVWFYFLRKVSKWRQKNIKYANKDGVEYFH